MSSLFLSLPTTILMNIPAASVNVAVNESCRRFLNPSGDYDMSTYMISGTFAGANLHIFSVLNNNKGMIEKEQQKAVYPLCNPEQYKFVFNRSLGGPLNTETYKLYVESTQQTAECTGSFTTA